MIFILQKHESTKLASIASFIKELKDNLSDESFQTFKEALSKYKEVSTCCPLQYTQVLLGIECNLTVLPLKLITAVT